MCIWMGFWGSVYGWPGNRMVGRSVFSTFCAACHLNICILVLRQFSKCMCICYCSWMNGSDECHWWIRYEDMKIWSYRMNAFIDFVWSDCCMWVTCGRISQLLCVNLLKAGRTALICSAAGGHLVVTQLLLDRGANPNVADSVSILSVTDRLTYTL